MQQLTMTFADDLRRHVTDYEELDRQRLVIQAKQKKVIAAAEADEIDKKVFKRIIGLRKLTEEEVETRNQLTELYLKALKGQQK